MYLSRDTPDPDSGSDPWAGLQNENDTRPRTSLADHEPSMLLPLESPEKLAGTDSPSSQEHKALSLVHGAPCHPCETRLQD